MNTQTVEKDKKSVKKKTAKKSTNLPAITTQEVGLVPVNLNALMEAAIKKGAGIDTLERLVALRLQLEQEAARKAYFTALAAFQRDCPIIPKTKTVFNNDKEKTVRYRYAPIEVIVEYIKEPLSRHGLSSTLDLRQTDRDVTGIFEGHHVDGHKETTAVTVPVMSSNYMNAAQAVISARTYAIRIALCNGWGIVTADEDDDGNASNLQPNGKLETKKKKKSPASEMETPLSEPKERNVTPSTESTIRFAQPTNAPHSPYVEIMALLNSKEQSREGPVVSLFANQEKVDWKAKADAIHGKKEELVALLQELDEVSEQRRKKIKEEL